MTDSSVTAAGNSISSQLGNLLSGQPVRYEKGKRYGRFITPAGSLSSSQPGGPPCWASPLAFGLIGFNCRVLAKFLSFYFWGH
jgi:hypothetical protein